jgi:60 kDa SS-A/Ro ribonucleoprotein
MRKYTNLAKQPTPQREPLDKRQVKNNAGGYVYQVDDWARLRRFLILGSDSNTYYQTARALTRENAAVVQRCLDENAERTINEIVTVSTEAFAPKNDPAIFALALAAAHADLKARQRALIALPMVCRTSTHLFGFVSAVEALGRGWGRTLKRAVKNWYDGKSVDDAAFQMVKYRSREDWTQGDMLKLAHPRRPAGAETDHARASLYRWARGLDFNREALPGIVQAHIEVMAKGTSKKRILELIRTHRLPWEALPTEVHKDPEVWRALLPHMGLTAIIRNLGRLTSLGAIKPLSDEADFVVDKIIDVEQLRRARIHPFNALLALKVYASGKALKGGYGGEAMTWEPVSQIVTALDCAFDLAFKAFDPTGKRYLTAVDVSASMSQKMMDSPLEVCEGAAALAMVTLRAEKRAHVMAFDQGLRELKLSAKSSLADVLEKTKDINGGGTDCSLPMLYAADHGLEVDVFQVLTDNETWAGRMHPMEALRRYRKKTGIPAKLVVCGMTSTGFTIADPNDPGALDVVGFDASAPAVIADFARH